MTTKTGTLRVERNRAMKGQRDMRKTNREQAKRIAQLEDILRSTLTHLEDSSGWEMVEEINKLLEK